MRYRGLGRWLGWLRHRVVITCLTMVLIVLEMLVGCDSGSDDGGPPAAYYGPAPADVLDGQGSDSLGLLDDAPDTTDDPDIGPVVYYGPQPVDVVDDAGPTPDDSGPVVYYGPQPVDIVDDAGPTPDDSGPVVYYGPQPVDVVDDAGSAPLDGGSATDDGQLPTDADPSEDVDCPPMAYYGPPPCPSDDQCVQDFGSNWYCDQEQTLPDGCGGTISWPTCAPKGG